VLYADGPLLEEFPPALFFDDDVAWHQQQFGVGGQVASASLAVDGRTVHALTYVSDLVQRIGRRREHKTRVEKVFKGWAHMLVNAVLAFADERGARTVRSASADLAHRHTDRDNDNVGRVIFDRVYDETVNSVFPAVRDGDWWTVDVAAARERMLVPTRGSDARARRRAICISHDVERGLGHRDVDARFAAEAERSSPAHLSAMSQIESARGVRATYCVVGCILDEVRAQLAGAGHCLAFHSFDHRIDRHDQLLRCREVDYRLKGYRPPQSVIGPELTDRNLLYRNFEWLASSPKSLGVGSPELSRRLVRIPVALDDFPLHTGQRSYDEWERMVMERVEAADVAVIGMHDCYADHWLDRYDDFLARLGELGELRTLDDVAGELTLASAA
jgi:hypothetical protein